VARIADYIVYFCQFAVPLGSVIRILASHVESVGSFVSDYCCITYRLAWTYVDYLIYGLYIRNEKLMSGEIYMRQAMTASHVHSISSVDNPKFALRWYLVSPCRKEHW
jgi:hypothetical protein